MSDSLDTLNSLVERSLNTNVLDDSILKRLSLKLFLDVLSLVPTVPTSSRKTSANLVRWRRRRVEGRTKTHLGRRPDRSNDFEAGIEEGLDDVDADKAASAGDKDLG